MAEPARKPQIVRQPASPASTPTPQLRPRALRAAPAEAPSPNEPRRLQRRIAAAFTGRVTTPLEKALMQAIIVAATCLVVLSAVGQGGVLAGLFR